MPRTTRLFVQRDTMASALGQLVRSADGPTLLRHDPLGCVHRYTDPADRELVGWLSAAVAYGRVDLFLPRLHALCDTLGTHPSARLQKMDADRILDLCGGFAYRMTGPAEVGALLYRASRLQREHGSIGALMSRLARTHHDWREVLTALVDALWDDDLSVFVGQPQRTRRLQHLVSNPRDGSACKRLNLYVRWMVRPDDGVDLGLWAVDPSRLIIPLDTHVHRISRLLGLTHRSDLSWRTAEEVTAALRKIDPRDPVRFDFALSHRGISQSCTGRRVDTVCGPCAIRSVCREGRKMDSTRKPLDP